MEQSFSFVPSISGLENGANKNSKLNRTNGSIETRSKVNIREYSTNFSNSRDDREDTQNVIAKENNIINDTIYKTNNDTELMEDDNNRVTHYTTYETTIHTTIETSEEEGSGTGITDHSRKTTKTPILDENLDIGE